MDPQNSGLDCILCRDLKVWLRQSFNSLLQVSIAACSSLSQPAPCASFLNSVAIEFSLSRQIFLWLFNQFSFKVCRFIHSMSRQSHVCLLERLCCDIDNCVVTLFLCSFFKFVS